MSGGFEDISSHQFRVREDDDPMIAPTRAMTLEPLPPAEGLGLPPGTATAEARTQVKRTRASKPKVKTGCTTCKIRRIKCDEAKPSCKKCTSTGRKCDGYEIPGNGKNFQFHVHATFSVASVPTNPWNKLFDYSGTQLELRYLSFFRHQTAPILSGYFDCYFWNNILLQVGYSEPTIQHAMMAVASIHEQVEATERDVFRPSRRSGGRGLDHDRCFALQQYNKAIACLNKRVSEGRPSEDVVLMCCVLFICLEFMRGNNETAVAHLHSGIEIMASWRARCRKLLVDEPLLMAQSTSIADNLAQMFSRLTIQSMLCGRPPPLLLPPPLSEAEFVALTPAIFPSLDAARTSLDYLMKITLMFLREACDLNYHLAIPPEAKDRLDNLTGALHRWSQAFDLFAASLPVQTRQEIRAVKNLRILCIVTKVWLSSALSDDESVFDEQTAAFEEVVGLARSMNDDALQSSSLPLASAGASGSGHSAVLTHSSSSTITTTSKFTFEMGIIPPLYFVATKCRVPSIRRAAIALLETTMPRREGIWIASLYVAMAKRIVAIEEGVEGRDPNISGGGVEGGIVSGGRTSVTYQHLAKVVNTTEPLTLATELDMNLGVDVEQPPAPTLQTEPVQVPSYVAYTATGMALNDRPKGVAGARTSDEIEGGIMRMKRDAKTGEAIPPEWRRIRNAFCNSINEDYELERVRRVTFVTRPDEPDGQCVVREEWLKW